MFVLTVVATIALGLGINTAVFTIFNSYVLRPISVRDPGSLYELDWRGRNGSTALTAAQYEQIRKNSPAFTETLPRATCNSASMRASLMANSSPEIISEPSASTQSSAARCFPPMCRPQAASR